MSMEFSPLAIKHSLGHPLVIFYHLLASDIKIMTITLWYDSADTLKRLQPLIGIVAALK